MITPPSPIPPWHRPIQTPATQVISEDATIDLGRDLSLLDLEVRSPSVTVEVTLPDGNHMKQYHTIMIQSAQIGKSETFTVTGTFANCTTLTFNDVGHTAVLQWDGDAWHLISGNCISNA